jgi:hypothetical protein
MALGKRSGAADGVSLQIANIKRYFYQEQHKKRGS